MAIEDLLSSATPINGESTVSPAAPAVSGGGISGLLAKATAIQSAPVTSSTVVPKAGLNLTPAAASAPVTIPNSPITPPAPVDTSKMFSGIVTPNMKVNNSTPAVDTNQIADNSKLGIAKNTLGGIPAAATKVGQYIYDQGMQTLGISPDDANNPGFLKQVAKAAPASLYNIGKQIITHPLVSGSQMAKGTTLGLLNFLSNAIVNYVPGLVAPAAKSQTLQIMQAAFQKALFPNGQNNIGKGFTQAGGAAIPIAASGGLAEGAGALGADEAGQFGAGTAGFLVSGQSQLPSDSSLKDRAQNALDSLVQQGLFTAGSYGYEIAKGVITEGVLNAFHGAAGQPTTDGKGVSDLHQEINDVSNEHGPAVAHVAMTEKGIDPDTATHLMNEAKASETATKVQDIQDGFRPVGKDEIIPAGYTTKMNVTTGEQMTNAPLKAETAAPTKETVNEETPKVSTQASRNEAANKPVETGNEAVPSKSVSINQMQEHLSPEEFDKFKDDTAHQKADRTEQVNKARSFVNDFSKKADAIIFKGENPPEGLRTQDIFTEARIKALDDYKSGNGTLEDYMKYVKADELLGSRSGSELGARANRFDKNDPASWLQKAREVLQRSDIKYAEEKSSKTKTSIDKETEKMTASVRKTRATLIDYQGIIDKITC